MFSLAICFGPTNTVWNLLFKDETGAKVAASMVRGNADINSLVQTLTDDFGQEITFKPSQVHAMLVEDLDLSQQGQIERGLHHARSQAKAQQRAASDPTIRTAAMAQGPAVLSGGIPNGRFND